RSIYPLHGLFLHLFIYLVLVWILGCELIPGFRQNLQLKNQVRRLSLLRIAKLKNNEPNDPTKHFSPLTNISIEVVEEVVDGSLEFLILASDGLWDVVSNESEQAAKLLLQEASRRGSADNITCVVVDSFPSDLCCAFASRCD
ncbi:hypothetical protein HPP92_015309, partial [Vanilla planifolia]